MKFIKVHAILDAINLPPALVVINTDLIEKLWYRKNGCHIELAGREDGLSVTEQIGEILKRIDEESRQ